ncbi:YceK/YidQ family lipoprotein [Stieleria varia]|uniref:YceK/YidQ family lipoprotein n=1 Tax=Stieleria varia TaxID=2528005 RepID=UPI001E44658C|nr:YceK/YidQ family lipoprotein [Stieleria varia]
MRSIVPIAIAIAILLPGCGTLRNVSSIPESANHQYTPAPKLVYGGVKDDLILASESAVAVMEFPMAKLLNLVCATGFAIDVPFSLVGDTLTLPSTIPAAIDRATVGYYLPDENNDTDEPERTDSGN